MPRRPRIATGGYAYHVLNRAVGRMTIFRTEEDYAAMVRVIEQVHRRLPTRILSYCLMPNHWHLVLWPRADGELSEFMRLLTVTHTQRWHAHRHSAGTGPLYQGRFKSFPVQQNEHLAMVCRYVERNALAGGLVSPVNGRSRAERWRWGSAFAYSRPASQRPGWLLPAEKWPMDRPAHWLAWVNETPEAEQTRRMEASLERSRPLGQERWVQRTARALSLESTLRPRGRPQGSPEPAAVEKR